MEHPEKAKVVPILHALRADGELVEIIRRAVETVAREGAPGHDLVVGIHEMITPHELDTAAGAVLLNALWVARQMSHELKIDESKVLASICAALLSIQNRIKTQKGLSSN